MLILVRKARRRVLHNELLSQGANSISAALLAFILLLILGTEVLNWYWLTLIPAAAAGAALYLVRKRLPSLYVTAQKVDRQAGLSDALSTAVFFHSHPESRAQAAVRRVQFDQAERLAASVDLRRAIPYSMPRTAYAMAALFLVASSLLALRYGLTRRLDLSQPMARILQQSLGFGENEKAKADQRKNLKFADSAQEEAQNTQQQDPKVSDDPNQAAGDSLEENEQNQVASNMGKADQNAKNDAQQGEPNGKDEQKEGEGNPSEDNQNQGSQGAQKEGQNQQSAANQNSNSSQSNPSLMSRMKEAMQNLLSSMKQQPSQANSQQQQNGSPQNSKSNKGQQGSKQQGQKGDRQNGGQSDEQDQLGEEANGQSSPGQGQEKGDSPQDNKQPGGGIGNRDGSKDVKQAEQLAAMGKITQIIGKRSATLSGEATVEVQSTAQQLRTEYTNQRVQHAEAGAEISRDEVPVAVQSYVEQYFEQVRKQPAPKK